MMKRADRKGGFLILFLCELVGWPATFLSLGKSGHRRAQVNHCCRHIYTDTEAKAKNPSWFHLLDSTSSTDFWMVHLPLSSKKTLHISCTNAVIGVVLCWLGVFACVFREWHSLVLQSGGFRMTSLHGNEQKLHPRLCWNHDFSLCHMRLGEFLAQHAFTMLDHKHGRVATLFLPFRCDNLMKAAFR